MRFRDDEELALAYEQDRGYPPQNLSPDHPDLWQWEYRGRPEERADLLGRMSEEPISLPEQGSLPGLAA